VLLSFFTYNTTSKTKNSKYYVGTPLKAKYKKLRRRKKETVKARAGKNSFPPTPFLFARPSGNFQKSSAGFS
jgi:hypothetical protein